jgi:urease accessory protein
MKTHRLSYLAPLGFFLCAPLAQAHPGHGPADFATGLIHPFTGLDHLLAMVAVGLWAAQLGGRARWLLPGTFVAAMLLGAIGGIAGLPPAGAEWGILASVFILGLALAAALRPPLWIGLAAVAAAGGCHGIAHGAEMPPGAASLEFLAGMVAATALLHALGVGAGTLATRQGRLLRWAGAGVIAGGFGLLLA